PDVQDPRGADGERLRASRQLPEAGEGRSDVPGPHEGMDEQKEELMPVRADLSDRVMARAAALRTIRKALMGRHLPRRKPPRPRPPDPQRLDYLKAIRGLLRVARDEVSQEVLANLQHLLVGAGTPRRDARMDGADEAKAAVDRAKARFLARTE